MIDCLCWNVLCASEINLPLEYGFGQSCQINNFSSFVFSSFIILKYIQS